MYKYEKLNKEERRELSGIYEISNKKPNASHTMAAIKNKVKQLETQLFDALHTFCSTGINERP